MARFIKMKETDCVATALDDLRKGGNAEIFSPDNIKHEEITALNDIPFGNKIALANMNAGDTVVKYGVAIGECTGSIKKGQLVHVHNVKSRTVDLPRSFKQEVIRQMKIEVKEDN